MNDIFDVLEICLQEIENGADVEAVLASYPHLAVELRPILKASIMARSMSAPAPSSHKSVRRGRAKVLQHAARMREAKAAPRSKRVIPIFQRLAIAFTLAALFLTSGTGLVSASSSALPGEKLYPVKLTWENVRLFFTFNEESRETLENSFENERLDEVNELLVEGRDETIQFAGVYMEANGITYVSGIHVVVLDTSSLPVQPLSNGDAVVVTGHTNSEGFVEVESIELLPAGTIVPPGKPVEAEDNPNSAGSGADDGSKNENKVNGNIDHGDDAINNDRVNGNDNQNSDNGNDGGNTGNSNDSGGNSGSSGGSDDHGGGDNSGSGSDGGGGDDSGGSGD